MALIRYPLALAWVVLIRYQLALAWVALIRYQLVLALVALIRTHLVCNHYGPGHVCLQLNALLPLLPPPPPSADLIGGGTDMTSRGQSVCLIQASG